MLDMLLTVGKKNQSSSTAYCHHTVHIRVYTKKKLCMRMNELSLFKCSRIISIVINENYFLLELMTMISRNFFNYLKHELLFSISILVSCINDDNILLFMSEFYLYMNYKNINNIFLCRRLNTFYFIFFFIFY